MYLLTRILSKALERNSLHWDHQGALFSKDEQTWHLSLFPYFQLRRNPELGGLGKYPVWLVFMHSPLGFVCQPAELPLFFLYCHPLPRHAPCGQRAKSYESKVFSIEIPGKCCFSWHGKSKQNEGQIYANLQSRPLKREGVSTTETVQRTFLLSNKESSR